MTLKRRALKGRSVCRDLGVLQSLPVCPCVRVVDCEHHIGRIWPSKLLLMLASLDGCPAGARIQQASIVSWSRSKSRAILWVLLATLSSVSVATTWGSAANHSCGNTLVRACV